MSRQAVSRHLRELMSSIDTVLEFYGPGISFCSNDALQQRIDTCNSESLALHHQYTHILSRAQDAAQGLQTAAALDWIEPCVGTGVVPWLIRTFKLIASKAAEVLDRAAPVGARRNVAASLNVCGPSAFMLLGNLIDQLHSRAACWVLLTRLNACTLPTTPIAELVDALSSSGLVPAAAGMILQVPLVDESVSPLAPMARNLKDTAINVHAAMRDICLALCVLQRAHMLLLLSSGSTSAPGVAQLGRQLEHSDVTALRHAMLQRLAAHGGLQPPPPEGEGEGDGVAAEGSPAEAQAWWLPLLEAQRGALTGGDDEWLEDDHCVTVLVSLGYWRGTELREVTSCGNLRSGRVPLPASAPPPKTVARLAARTAEALCRLYRGQGLGGAYGSPQRHFARSPDLKDMLDFSDEASIVSEAELQACLPHWLEAAAWGLALCGEALAGAVERRDGVAPKVLHWISQVQDLGKGAAGIAQLIRALAALSGHTQRGTNTLHEEARADLSAQLRRAGLGASLDRALRLAFALFDRAAAPGASEWERSAAKELREVPAAVADILRCHLTLPMPEPAGATAEEGGASGVLVTAAKRASALARKLEELVEAGDGGGGGSMGEIFKPSSAVLGIVISGAAIIREELRKRQQTISPGDGGLAPKAGSDAVPAARAPGGERAFELLALLTRSACHLAAQLAAVAARLSGDRGNAAVSPKAIAQAIVATAQTLDQLSHSCPDRGWGLTETQLIACQPHRLLAAAAALMCAMPADVHSARPPMLPTALTRALAALAARSGLSLRVRAWLAPPAGPEPPAATQAAMPAPNRAERGCLERPLRAAVASPNFDKVPYMAEYALALLDVARGSSSDCSGRANGTVFGDIARTISAAQDDEDAGPSADEARARVSNALDQYLGRRAGRDAEAAVAVAVPTALPAPLPVEAAALATRQLRVCANPLCANSGRAAEADLVLKQCAGCRAVRYCGAACQRAHWSEHRALCAELKAAATGEGMG
ncbi:hypothetical protein GPECTOR_32g522 [Gonium pectorale]|uniref:MYND-type domain-containing protein n=1 Tax=Gonium pectorale TaxID=33097 RepID=A0A150GDK0_GONPE|nr:hypothetical protein GPECTOR_32g522 [Gonium pectorale]|eukprot:KXZ47909.1 hypothetical protein GPECTOR_32g522 [Gonium pectorale]